LSTSSTDTGQLEPKLLEIGQIIRPHGLAGDVIVRLVSNRTERLDPRTVLTGQLPNGERRSFTVVSSSLHQGRYIVRFEGVSGKEGAESVRNTVLLAPPIEDDEALFVHELIGCEVVETNGESHGLVVAVQQNPASDLLVGEGGWLVPLRFVVSREPGRIVVDTPAGLFE
jgi:16S rRNA processing protein RimM